jgi:hypothetical protein
LFNCGIGSRSPHSMKRPYSREPCPHTPIGTVRHWVSGSRPLPGARWTVWSSCVATPVTFH